MEDHIDLFAGLIAKKLELPVKGVTNTLVLLSEGATIPFIARYRKERTGEMDEVFITQISEQFQKLQELAARKETILGTIEEQGKLTDELRQRIDATWNATELEDIYLPYRPRRRTKAQVAREQGLEPLAELVFKQREADPEERAKAFVKGDVPDVAAALEGAKYIIAEQLNEDEGARNELRTSFRLNAVVTCKVAKGKADTDEAQKFRDYFNISEPLKHCSGHRLLAMRRGEAAGILKVTLSPKSEDDCIRRLQRRFVRGRNRCGELVAEAAEDCYKRLLKPSIETEFAALSKDKADDEAIHVFAENLRQLLLSPPLGQKRVMGIDPGFRTGCKVVCLDEQGSLLHFEVIYPQREYVKSSRRLPALAEEYGIEAIAIGNGTASRETHDFVKRCHFRDKVQTFVVSEDGASIYSASKVARDEFPDQDVTVRGAVSIGRRLMDPLAELVKIDPKSIGVGQYQHDVDQAKLKEKLDQTVTSCVNLVGVNLNTASQNLLVYVSGLGPQLAKNIVDYRRQHGSFASRAQLKDVPRLGPVAYQQCAGFLRIPDAANPLDRTAVHPESYHIVEQMARDYQCTVADLIADKQKRQAVDVSRYITDEVGLPTLHDIMAELEKPGRDPRQQIEAFEFDDRVSTPEDLVEGMVLPGIVTNITKFGAFVDIGVHQDGLVHVSQMVKGRYVKNPLDVVKLHQHVQVKVLEVDLRRQRISLSMIV